MSTATPRIANGTPIDRRLGVAFLLLTLAAAVLVAVVVSQQVSKPAPAASTGNSHQNSVEGMPATHDLVVGGTTYTGIPSNVTAPAPAPAPGTHDLVVGGTTYTGIPSNVTGDPVRSHPHRAHRPHER